jgi:tRNA-splicing ligase RtcB
MIHSGSRNFGKKICDYYNALAKEMNSRWVSNVPSEWDLAFLPYDDILGQEYMTAMEYALKFAYENRHLMMERAKNVLYNVLEKYAGITGIKELINVDCHHNYAALENHYGKNVIVHRKGAVRARLDGIVIIPGSMGTKSYIGTGLGNSDSFNSCSHGSGRCLGRNEAKRKFSSQDTIEHMKSLDIIVLKPNKEDISEECPQAYKDIEDVIKQESDLISVTHRLVPLGVIKG